MHPTNPLPINPLPVNPLPVNPLPINPLPINPLPVNPLPINPLPINPLPVNPLPINPLPVNLLSIGPFSGNPLIWETNFPDVYGQTSIHFLKRCPGFYEAKKGDYRAALQVVRQCVNPRSIADLKRMYPDAVLLPVISNNKLPEAFAEVIGMPAYTDVRQLKTISRKSLPAMERLLHKPLFTGTITDAKKYILVDDVITQGGTVSALRKHVIDNGGTVAAIVTLSCSVNSRIVVPHPEDIRDIINRFNLRTLNHTLYNYGIAHDLRELTRPQMKYLLLFKELRRLIEKIEQTQSTVHAYFQDSHRQ